MGIVSVTTCGAGQTRNWESGGRPAQTAPAGYTAAVQKKIELTAATGGSASLTTHTRGPSTVHAAARAPPASKAPRARGSADHMALFARSPRVGSPLVSPAADLVPEERDLIKEGERRSIAQQQVQKALLEQQKAVKQREADERRWLKRQEEKRRKRAHASGILPPVHLLRARSLPRLTRSLALPLPRSPTPPLPLPRRPSHASHMHTQGSPRHSAPGSRRSSRVTARRRRRRG